MYVRNAGDNTSPTGARQTFDHADLMYCKVSLIVGSRGGALLSELSHAAAKLVCEGTGGWLVDANMRGLYSFVHW